MKLVFCSHRRPCAVAAGLLFLVISVFSGCKKPAPSAEQVVSVEPQPPLESSAQALLRAEAPVEMSGVEEPTVLYTGQDHPVTVEVIGGNLYWLNAGKDDKNKLVRNKGAIMRGGVAGGEATVLFAKQNLPESLATDGKNLYWTSEYDVFRGSVDGGRALLVFSGNEEMGASTALSWRDERLVFGLMHPRGGSLRVLDSGGKQILAPLSVVGGVSALTVTGKYIFAYSHNQLTIGRMPLEGGEVRVVQTGVVGCSSMVNDNEAVYWVESDGGQIRSMAIEGGGEARVVSRGYRRPWDVALDGDWLWVTDRAAGTINRVRKAGGRGQVVVRGLQSPHSVAVDGGFVYWAEPEKGSISRVKKPVGGG